MSEIINNNIHKINDLVAYAKGILHGERGIDLYNQYTNSIKAVTPLDVLHVVDELVKTNQDMLDIKRAVNKILNVFYLPIKDYGKAKVEKGSFLYYLMEENKEVEKRVESLKSEIKRIFKHKEPGEALRQSRDELKIKILELQEYEKHYLKKENILFPYFEKVLPKYRCVNVMWSMHDDVRQTLKNLIENLDRELPFISDFNLEIGKLFFSLLPVIFREEYILFPIAEKAIKSDVWDEMLIQSLEIGYAFIKIPKIESKQKNKTTAKSVVNKHAGFIADDLIDLETGKLKIEQIKSLFNNLPLDITYVDENDEVRYFSNPKDRFFVRSKAIIGRKVQNCHPHESVHVVNKIVNSFKSGKKDNAVFWIQIKGKFILIQYFPVRDEQGNYKGVIEVSQDVTDIRELKGERRLLDWEDNE